MQFPSFLFLRALKSPRVLSALAFVTALMATFASLAPLAGAAQSVEPAKAISGKQLVANGGFNNGIDGWATNAPKSDKLTVTAAGLTGQAAKLSSKNEIVVLNDTQPPVSSVPRGSAYTMSAQVRTSRLNAVAQLRVREVTDDVVQSHTSQLKLTDEKWHQLTLSFRTTLEGSQLDLNVLFWNLVDTQYVFVDDVSLVKTSPAAAAIDRRKSTMRTDGENSAEKSKSDAVKPPNDAETKSARSSKPLETAKRSTDSSKSMGAVKQSIDSLKSVGTAKKSNNSSKSVGAVKQSADSLKSVGTAKNIEGSSTEPEKNEKTANPVATKDTENASAATSKSADSAKSKDSTPKPRSTSSATGHSCTPNALGGTKFGVNLNVSNSGSLTAAWKHAVNSFGAPDVVRSFNRGAPKGWSVASVATGADLSVSFKILPKDVLSGKYDSQLRSWFRSAPTNVEIYWTYYHEPEDQIEKGIFTAADYRAAWKHIVEIQRETCQPNMHSMLILMGWSVAPGSGRTFSDYYAGSKYIDVLGWDPYNPWKNNTQYKDPSAIFGKLISVSKAQGKPFAIAETGSLLVGNDSGAGRAAWLKRVASYLQNSGALFVTYFDTLTPLGNDFRLTDSASKNVWKTLVSRG